jgi:hypothetical protein
MQKSIFFKRKELAVGFLKIPLNPPLTKGENLFRKSPPLVSF